MKIKSVTDVITNSSSEVFVMTPHEAEQWRGRFGSRGLGGDFSGETIDYQWIRDNLNSEYKLICKVFGLDEDLVTWEELLDEETIEAFLELNQEEILESPLLGNLEIVTVTDHTVSEWLEETLEDIRDDYEGPFYEYRH